MTDLTTQPNTEPLKVGDECRAAFEDEFGPRPKVGMHAARAWDERLIGFQAAWNRRTEPSPAEVGGDGVLVDWVSETDDPVAELDAIYTEYATTFGKFPDADMAATVLKVKDMLFSWWGHHRESIRQALSQQSKKD